MIENNASSHNIYFMLLNNSWILQTQNCLNLKKNVQNCSSTEHTNKIEKLFVGLHQTLNRKHITVKTQFCVE